MAAIYKSSVSQTPGQTYAEPGSAKRALVFLSPGSLMPWPGNARTHSRKQLKQLAKSINEFGFTSPVLTDEEGSILAGHGRVLAAGFYWLIDEPTVAWQNL